MTAKRKLGKRSIPGQQLGAMLAVWLNNPDKPRQAKRVTALIEEINDLTKTSPRKPKGIEGRVTQKVRAKRRRRQQTVEEMYWVMRLINLNLSFQGLHFRPEFQTPLRDNSWKIDWKPTSEFAAHVWVIARMGEHGWLWRVRRCAECKHWFYARKRDHEHCSDKCRQKPYRKSSKGKRTRKKYMKKYWPEYYEKNVATSLRIKRRGLQGVRDGNL